MSVADKAKRMAEIVVEINDVERARKETAKDYREQLDALWNELERLGGDVKSGQRSIGEEDE